MKVGSRTQRLQRLLTNLLIIFYLYTGLMMAWPWPAYESVKDALIGTVANETLQDLGIYHRLRLFSPYPPIFTGRLTFEVGYDNGMMKEWHYPRQKLSLGDQPNSYERYIFYYLCWNYQQKYQALWPAFTRYISKNCALEDAHPVTIRIVEQYANIPSPKNGIGKPWVKPNQELVLYSYDVKTDRGVIGTDIRVW